MRFLSSALMFGGLLLAIVAMIAAILGGHVHINGQDLSQTQIAVQGVLLGVGLIAVGAFLRRRARRNASAPDDAVRESAER